MARHRRQRPVTRRYRQRFRDQPQRTYGRPPERRMHVCPSCWTSRVDVLVGEVVCAVCGAFCTRCGLESSACRHEHAFATRKIAVKR